MTAPARYASKAAARVRRVGWRLHSPRPTARVNAMCEGPSWFRRLVADEFQLQDDSAKSDLRVLWSPTASTGLRPDGTLTVGDPFVSPTRSHPGSLRRLPPGCPPEFERLDAAARRLPARRRSSDRSRLDTLRSAQRSYRDAHQRSLRSLAGAVLEPSDSAAPSVEVVCVSRRPWQLQQVIDQFDAQTYPHRRLTIVLTSDDSESGAVDPTRWPHVTIERRPGLSLGRCLNEALDRSGAALVAKWDDDDWYGADYLTDLVLTRNATGAAITGKHSYFAYLARSERAILRFDGVEFCDTSFVAGGTLLIDRAALGDVRFPDVNLAEDGALLERCERRGLRIFAADPFNYVQYRGDANTWQVDDTVYARRALDVGHGFEAIAAAFV